VRNVEGGNLAEVPDARFEETLAALNAAGIKISSFGSAIANWARTVDGDFQKDVEDLKRAIPRMKKSGCQIIRIMSWPNAKTPWADDDWRKEVLKRVKVLVKMAEDGGVIIGMENCSGWSSDKPENMQRTLDEIKSKAFGIIYDTGNVIAHPGGPWAWYETCRPRTVYVHVKDGKAPKGGKEFYTWPGEGDAMVREAVADLLKTGYDGGFSIEPHLSSQVHLGTTADGKKDAFDIYVEYGRRFMKIVDEVRKKK
jgi:sugar phosphate isomerase/epimerase